MDTRSAADEAAHGGAGTGPAAACPDVEAFGEALSAALGQDARSPAGSAFIAQLRQQVSDEEVGALSPEDLAAIGAEFWRFAAERPGPGTQLRLVEVKGSDGRELDLEALQIVQDDAPFLVDSIMGEVTDRGCRVRAMLHPVLEVGRDAAGHRAEGAAPRAESMMLVLIEPIGATRGAALLQGVIATLDDVRAAVSDFEAMRELMRTTIQALEAGAPEATRPEIGEDLDFLRWLADDRFVFLGARVYTYPRAADGDFAPEEPSFSADGCFGVLRDQSRGVLRRESEPAVLSPAARSHIGDAPLVVAKANARSRNRSNGSNVSPWDWNF